MLRQETSDKRGILSMLAHTHSQRLNTTQRQPDIERPRYSSSSILIECKLLIDFLIIHDHNPTNDITMSIDIFCGTMHDNICTQIKWPLEVRTSKSVVDNKPYIMSVS